MFKMTHKGVAMTKHTSPYSSYLLRIWHSTEGEPQGWRVSLQDLGTGKRLGFADLESLFAFFETTGVEAAPQINGVARKEATDQAQMNTKLDD
jgi:hypothetical protein